MSEQKQLVDPITKYVYSTTEDGLVEVTDPTTGERGVFDETGAWQSGELTYVNRQLAGWIGRLSARRARTAPGADAAES